MELIAVSGLRKIYRTRDGPVIALQDIRFAIEKEQFVAIVGPSGCGKFTLLKILIGLIPASQGEARLSGIAITGQGDDTKRP
ncbi:ATP-binding cassette domain-containing protein [Paraburkholderia sp. EG287A]|uniref:ATP-binding cassette domain-containing protein n=1 Tax=unclassified Paraburkholderia TaxID=2615204 RepID=UPI0034D1660B